MMSGLTARSSSKPRPRRFITPARKLSAVTSEIDTNRLASATASGCLRFSRTDSLFTETWSKVAADIRP